MTSIELMTSVIRKAFLIEEMTYMHQIVINRINPERVVRDEQRRVLGLFCLDVHYQDSYTAT